MSKKKRRHRKKPPKEESVREFRKERSAKGAGHPRYVFIKKGNIYIGFPITHGMHYRGQKNIQLRKNPEPNPEDKRPVYISPKPEEIKKASDVKPDWKLHPEDIKMVEKLIEKLTDKGK